MDVVINNLIFTKSSLSRARDCVGVATHNDTVLVTNTKTKPTPIEFTKREWHIFIEGVKKGEFDHFGEK